MTPLYHMTYLQAIVIGLIQGLTELFPISSLGHTVLIPAWIGGTWGTLVSQESRPESPYLAFVVGLHLATGLVLLAWYWQTWVRIIRGLITSIARRRIATADERLAWLLVVATVPVGIAGLALEHPFRVLFAKPLAAAIFLTINGCILFLGERYRRRPPQPPLAPAPATPANAPGSEPPLLATAGSPAGSPAGPADPATAIPAAPAGAKSADPAGITGPPNGLPGGLAGGDPRSPADGDPGGGVGGPADGRIADQRLAGIGTWSAIWIGSAQILALLAGISREGVTMVGGLLRGMSHEDAMRFAFLLSTPVILAAGALKVPDLTGSLGNGIRGQVLAGSAAAAVTSLFAVVFLARYFRTRTLLPFAVYCVAAGLASIIRFAIW